MGLSQSLGLPLSLPRCLMAPPTVSPSPTLSLCVSLTVSLAACLSAVSLPLQVASPDSNPPRSFRWAATPLRLVGGSGPARLALLSALVVVGTPDLTRLHSASAAALAALDSAPKRRAGMIKLRTAAASGAGKAAEAVRPTR